MSGMQPNAGLVALTSADRTRLVAILKLLSSDHDGERAAAGLAATRMLRDRNLTWEAVLNADQTARARCAGARPRDDGGSWHADLTLCRRHTSRLNAWESEFVLPMGLRRKEPTPAQVATLEHIADKLRAGGRS